MKALVFLFAVIVVIMGMAFSSVDSVDAGTDIPVERPDTAALLAADTSLDSFEKLSLPAFTLEGRFHEEVAICMSDRGFSYVGSADPARYGFGDDPDVRASIVGFVDLLSSTDQETPVVSGRAGVVELSQREERALWARGGCADQAYDATYGMVADQIGSDRKEAYEQALNDALSIDGNPTIKKSVSEWSRCLLAKTGVVADDPSDIEHRLIGMVEGGRSTAARELERSLTEGWARCTSELNAAAEAVRGENAERLLSEYDDVVDALLATNG